MLHIYRVMPHKNILSLITFALSIKRMDLEVDEVQGVIDQIDLPCGSMEG